jgi:hypothetical protein
MTVNIEKMRFDIDAEQKRQNGKPESLSFRSSPVSAPPSWAEQRRWLAVPLAWQAVSGWYQDRWEVVKALTGLFDSKTTLAQPVPKSAKYASFDCCLCCRICLNYHRTSWENLEG